MTLLRVLALLLAALLFGSCAAGAGPPSTPVSEPAADQPVAVSLPAGTSAPVSFVAVVRPLVVPTDPPARAVASPPATGAVARSTPRSVAPVVFGMDLYRRGIYAMQATWWWCAAASVEMARNIILGQADHSSADQQRYFEYMHAHDVYSMPQREGVDLVGLLVGLRHFVDARYQLIAGRTFDAAVRAAVASIRRTRRPAALVVMNGHHVWLMTGFTASADPARDPNFRVLSVRVVGPLYGRQSVGGYDMPPDTRLSYAAFRRFLMPYHFKFGPTPWDHRFVVYGA
jgi:hypothetical protein